jgi:hypothetical protein
MFCYSSDYRLHSEWCCCVGECGPSGPKYKFVIISPSDNVVHSWSRTPSIDLERRRFLPPSKETLGIIHLHTRSLIQFVKTPS